jgi:transposase
VAPTRVQRPTRKGCPNRAVGFKRELATAACAPGVSVAKLALKHGVNTNLLFKWRREYRAGKFGVPIAAHTLTEAVEKPAPVMPTNGPSSIQLLPVVEVAATVVGDGTRVRSEPACIEIIFGCATVRICGTPEIAPLRAVLDCLARRR